MTKKPREPRTKGRRVSDTMCCADVERVKEGIKWGRWLVGILIIVAMGVYGKLDSIGVQLGKVSEEVAVTTTKLDAFITNHDKYEIRNQSGEKRTGVGL